MDLFFWSATVRFLKQFQLDSIALEVLELLCEANANLQVTDEDGTEISDPQLQQHVLDVCKCI